MEIHVLVCKLGKLRGLLIIDDNYNQALQGGNGSDCVITNSKRHKTNQTHPRASKKKTRNNVQRQVELEPRSCTQETFVVESIKPIHFGDDTQMDGSDGEAQAVLDIAMITTPIPLTKGSRQETIVHGGSPQ